MPRGIPCGVAPRSADFVRRGGRQTFPFTFIDPTGWTGFAMSTIAPLLRMEPGEVLINLMTKDVRRFIESPEQETQASFDKLFGRSGVKTRVAGLQGSERDDAVVEEYGASVRAFAVFKYMCSAIVLHPERDRTHFHLVYGTRHRKGVEVFKDAEKKAMGTQETARAAAQERRRQQATGMASLFGDTVHDSVYYNRLADTFTDSLARLTGDEQKAAKTTAFDLQMDPSAPGLSFHSCCEISKRNCSRPLRAAAVPGSDTESASP
jgi:hypothetical protein